MVIKVTARHFKARDSIIDHAKESAESLEHFYDGITKADVILSYEKAQNSSKVAEIKVAVYGAVLTGIARSEDFIKSIDQATEKVLVQLKRYKEKLHSKKRKQARATRIQE